MAAENGTRCVRVATHVTEADIGEQHIGLAGKPGMEACGFLMMVYMVPPEKVASRQSFSSRSAPISST